MEGHLLAYSIVAGCTLAILYIVYLLIMAGAKQPRLNRIVLMGILVMSFVVVPAAGSFYVKDAVVDPFAPMEKDQKVYTPRQGPIFVRKGERTDYNPVEVRMMAFRDQRLFKATKFCAKVYVVGVVAVLLMFVVSMARLALMIRRSEKRRLGDATLVIVDSDKPMSPFCFGRYVVLKRSVIESEYAEMILEHELTHVRRLHRIDLAVAYLGAAVCWYNPFAWSLLKSLREVHEYEVDASMIDEGTDAREYQMMLIKKVGGVRLQAFADNLNNSKLRKRIVMMQKNRSSKVRRGVGVLAALSGVAFALFFIQTPSMAEMITDFDQSGLSALPKSQYRLDAEREAEEFYKTSYSDNSGHVTEYDVILPEDADMDEVVSDIIADSSADDETETDAAEKTRKPTEDVPLFYVDGKLMGRGSESLKDIDPSTIGSMTVDKSHGETRIYVELKKENDATASKDNLKLSVMDYAADKDNAEVTVVIEGAQSLTVNGCRLIGDGMSFQASSMSMQGSDGKQVLTAKFTGISETKDLSIEVMTDKGTIIKFLPDKQHSFKGK